MESLSCSYHPWIHIFNPIINCASTILNILSHCRGGSRQEGIKLGIESLKQPETGGPTS